MSHLNKFKRRVVRVTHQQGLYLAGRPPPLNLSPVCVPATIYLPVAVLHKQTCSWSGLSANSVSCGEEPEMHICVRGDRGTFVDPIQQLRSLQKKSRTALQDIITTVTTDCSASV